MQSTKPPRVVILEDDPGCRRLLQVALRADYDCAFCGSGKELLRSVEATAADLVLLDIGLPGENGLEIAREVRRRSQVPIIFVSGLDKETHEELALNLGGDDFVGKPFSSSVLVARIRSVLKRGAGKELAQPGVITYSDLYLDPGKFAVSCGRPCGNTCRTSLTEMEFDILTVLMQSGAGIVTRDDIWRAIAGRDWDRQNRAIDVHIAHLRRKLVVAFGVTELIQTLRGGGYRLAANSWSCGR